MCLFLYPARNKVINEYKFINDNYSWDDEFDFENDNAKSKKKFGKTETYSDNSTDTAVELAKADISKTDNTQDARKQDLKTSTSTKLVSMHTSKSISLVDMILLEESARVKHSKTH